MKRLPIALAAVIMIAALSIGAGATNYADSQVVCQIAGSANAETVASSVGAVVSDSISLARTYLFTVSKSQPLSIILSTLMDDPSVITAQPNYYCNILDLEQVSQPFVDQTSQPFVDGVSPASYYGQYGNHVMDIDSALLTATAKGTVVAIIDAGLDNTHPLFAKRLNAASYDFVDNDVQPWVSDGVAASHGTFTAGIVARSAPDASLIIIRCFDATGGGTTFHIAQGIYHALRMGAQIINMSFGMNDDDVVLNSAVSAALNHGVVVVAAAGNQGIYFGRYPATIPGVISIAAVDAQDKKASFSNYHETVCASASGVDLYGPLSGGDVWGWWSGTSFSAAFASGLAALIKSANPSYTPDQVSQRIRVTADNIDKLNPSYVGLLGSGRLNFYSAAYLPGDANRNGRVNVGDAVYLLNYVFRNGRQPRPLSSGDLNCDNLVNVGDVVYIINYAFRNGPPPQTECK